jgi:hypothetical protein
MIAGFAGQEVAGYEEEWVNVDVYADGGDGKVGLSAVLDLLARRMSIIFTFAPSTS